MWIQWGSLMMFLAVALGAFGAHALKSRLSADMLAIFDTGVRYHFIHALALFVVAWAAEKYPNALVNNAGWLFVIGIIIFSGSLYVLSFTGVRAWGAVTPMGGLAFLIGWGMLFFGAR